MKQTFKYKLYPTRKQKTIMLQTIEECRLLYNHLLEERKNSWEREKKSIGYYNQATSLVNLKQCHLSLINIHSKVLQNVAVRVDLAFKTFFRRIKKKEKAGYPRFRGKERYDSFTYPQTGFEIINNGLNLSKIGTIKLKLHRPIQGVIKTCTVKKTSTNKWYVTFSCEVEQNIIPKTNKVVGIDVGLKSFATFSNGSKIENPRFFRKEEKDLVKAQHKFSKVGKRTIERIKSYKVVSRIHERITNKRHNFTHQESRKIVNNFDVICVEDLSINKMVHNHCLSKSIMDAAWSQFFQQLAYKAAYAGRQFVKVNPAYTSQNCSNCGHREAKKLSERIHSCSCCGFTANRDHNAALNVLALGLQSLEEIPKSL